MPGNDQALVSHTVVERCTVYSFSIFSKLSCLMKQQGSIPPNSGSPVRVLFRFETTYRVGSLGCVLLRDPADCTVHALKLHSNLIEQDSPGELNVWCLCRVLLYVQFELAHQGGVLVSTNSRHGLVVSRCRFLLGGRSPSPIDRELDDLEVNALECFLTHVV